MRLRRSILNRVFSLLARDLPEKSDPDLPTHLRPLIRHMGLFDLAVGKHHPPHFPKAIEESIVQAQADSASAATVLSRDSIELEGNISQVVDENCDGCAYCVDTCPYKAITLLEYMREGAVKKTVEVNETVCKGCGCCMATCPKMGIYVKGFKLEQISAQVDAALEVSP